MTENNTPENTPLEPDNSTPGPKGSKFDRDAVDVRHLRGMFRNWFLDFASYVILERAVPHIDDGLKPVQRRILHAMKTLEDGRYNKVANVVGTAMQYHPHGDASIKDALVQLGQKDLLIDTQGNWGNTLTGAQAAAGRYIEARLSLFALETLFNSKITEWTMSYDGRKKEPVVLPAKFPLLLFQGVEGIAVGLSSKILPHNFNEILDAAVSYLKGEEFTLYPDFPTGGFIDVSRYNDGERGGTVKIRAKIEKIDNKTLAITEIPYGRTTGAVIASIIKAYEKGKIKLRKVDDNTAKEAMILVHLMPNTSSDKTIDALYAFTDCEISVSPNCCVISDNKPHFLGVSDVLRHNVDNTKRLFRKELEIQLSEVRESLQFASLEKIFIEKRIYKDKGFEQSENMQAAVDHIRGRLIPYLSKEPYASAVHREVSDDDILRLMEIRMKRILKFSSDDADRLIASYFERIAQILSDIENLTEFTIRWFESLKEKYGEAYPRKTVIRGFDNIEVATVAEANERLYINREDGFIGTSLKKDEFICNCSMLDDIIVIYKDGRYKVVKVAEKLFVDKDVLHVAVFKRNDERTIYNIIYQNGKGGAYYMKRCAITGVTRDKEYNLTQGEPKSRIVWFTANSNGEAEVVKVALKPKQKLKKLQIDIDFSELKPKGKTAMGKLVTRNDVHRISLKEKGVSTLGGLKVWFDPDILRLNNDGRGEYLGEFLGDDKILVVTNSGEYYLTGFDLANHYDDNIMKIEKYRPGHVWTAILNDADNQMFPYMKRFTFEPSLKKQRYLGDNPKSELILLSDTPLPRFRITFGGPDEFREPLDVTASEFIAVKSFKAKGKRLTTFTVDEIDEIEPEAQGAAEEVTTDAEADEATLTDPDTSTADENAAPADNELSDDELRDEINGQQRIF
ncbi:MAG: DNA gyrase/topoisomerase IV subunit A [Muribaculaceae bacterium]|nr:DNA gyrase/topoisomerase IV subunit A [Muribaculaceae bacterium]